MAKVYGDLKDLDRARNVRALSRMAKEEMEDYSAVPPLVNLELSPRAVSLDGSQIQFSAVWSELPSPGGTSRRLMIFPVLMKAEGKLDHVAVTI